MPTPMDPTSTGLPVRGEPEPADARRRAPAVPQARGGGTQLRQGPLRGDADPRGGGAAVPQAAAPLGDHGRPVVLDRGRPVRPRVPLPAQRAAEARPDPRAARAVRPAAQHPAGPRAAAVGGAPHRGAPRRPGRDVHQDAPRPRRRRLLDAAAAARAVQGPRRASAWRRCGRRARARRSSEQRRRRRGVRTRASSGVPPAPLRTALGDQRRRGRAARGAGEDALARRPQRDVGGVALRPAHDHQQEDHRLPPVRRRGLADGAASRRSARPRARPSTTSCSRCAAARCAPTSTSSARCRTASLVAMVPVGLQAKQSQSASASGGNAVGVGDGQARHGPGRPGRPAARRCTDSMADRQGGARHDDAGADPRDERAGAGARDPRADAAGCRASPGRRST